MAIQQASEHAVARGIAQSLGVLVSRAILPDSDVTMDPELLDAEDALSEFIWSMPVPGSKCLYAESLRTGERFRIVVKPLKSGDSSDE